MSVKIVNLDGLSFIGPGSEWFWTMLQLVVVAVSLVGLYRQVRLQASASAIEVLESLQHEWYSERLLRSQLDVLSALRQGVDPTMVPAGAAGAISAFWERVGTLAHGNHIDSKLLWSLGGHVCQTWWAILVAWVVKTRSEEKTPGLFEDLEWLAGTMVEMDRGVGQMKRYETPLASTLESMIAAAEDRIRVEEKLRTVIVASPLMVSLAQPLKSAAPSTRAESQG